MSPFFFRTLIIQIMNKYANIITVKNMECQYYAFKKIKCRLDVVSGVPLLRFGFYSMNIRSHGGVYRMASLRQYEEVLRKLTKELKTIDDNKVIERWNSFVTEHIEPLMQSYFNDNLASYLNEKQ